MVVPAKNLDLYPICRLEIGVERDKNLRHRTFEHDADGTGSRRDRQSTCRGLEPTPAFRGHGRARQESRLIPHLFLVFLLD